MILYWNPTLIRLSQGYTDFSSTMQIQIMIMRPSNGHPILTEPREALVTRHLDS